MLDDRKSTSGFCFFGSRKKLASTYAFFSPELFIKISNFCPSDFHKILHSHSTSKGAPACSKASKSYDWNMRNNQNSPKNSRFSTFWIFSKIVRTIRTKISTVILYHIMVLCYAISLNSYCWDVRNSQNEPKMPKNSHFSIYLIFAKTPYDSNENLQSLSTP